jgi:hypothetical protein
VSIDELPTAQASVRPIGDSAKVLLESSQIMSTLQALSGWAIEHGYDISDLQVHRPALEDVYLGLTEAAN